jgi:hypothetical protein
MWSGLFGLGTEADGRHFERYNELSYEEQPKFVNTSPL